MLNPVTQSPYSIHGVLCELRYLRSRDYLDETGIYSCPRCDGRVHWEFRKNGDRIRLVCETDGCVDFDSDIPGSHEHGTSGD